MTEQRSEQEASHRDTFPSPDMSSGQEHDKEKDDQKHASYQDKSIEKKKQNEKSDTIEESIIYWQNKDEVSKKFDETKRTLQRVVGLGESFDIILREMVFGERRVGLFYVNGFAKEEVMTLILSRMSYLEKEEMTPNALKSLFERYIPHLQVERENKLSSVINKVLAGSSAFFIDHESTAIIVDCKSFPVRGLEEPSLERVVRGARDGFGETLLTNVTLVRRRVRDPGLMYEMVQVGRRTRTDVCIAYIDDIADKRQVESVRNKIKAVNLDGLPHADKQLEEAIINKFWNPYPLVRYSERPDVVASHLLDGSIVIFVDTSPSVIILPTTFFDLCQHAEENRQTAFMGTYLRSVRFIGIFASLFILPMWLLLVIEPGLKPAALQIIGPQETGKIPLIFQFLIAELGVDLMRMAAVHTPSPLAIALGLLAAILVGDIAVKTGVFVNEVILYMAIAAVGMFATPSYELGLANRIVRLVLLIAVAVFRVPGLVIGTTVWLLWLTLHRSYNASYLWPFIPFNAQAMYNILIRQPFMLVKTRPSLNQTRDNTKMPPRTKR